MIGTSMVPPGEGGRGPGWLREGLCRTEGHREARGVVGSKASEKAQGKTALLCIRSYNKETLF